MCLCCSTLWPVVAEIGRWLRDTADNLTPKDFEKEANHWTGEQAVAMLAQTANLTPGNVSEMQAALSIVSQVRTL